MVQITTDLSPNFVSNPSFFNTKNGFKWNEHVPIVVDAGSYQWRVGFKEEQEPLLGFEPILHRMKNVGNKIAIGNLPGSKGSLSTGKSPYEPGSSVVVNIDVFESLLDASFSKLEITHGNPHLIITEPACNPRLSRSEMIETAFESYNLGNLSLILDAPCSLVNTSINTCLLVSLSHSSVIIYPIVNGAIIWGSVIRLEGCGGVSMVESLMNLLQLKMTLEFNFSGVKPFKMTLDQSRNLFQKFCYVSESVPGMEILDEDVAVKLVPVPGKAQAQAALEDESAKAIEAQQKRIANSERLKKASAERREKQNERKLAELKELQEIRAKIESTDEEDEVGALLEEAGYDSLKKLDSAISSRSIALGLLPSAAPLERNYELLTKPDSELSPEQIREKRKLRLLKSGEEARERAKQEKAKQDALRAARLQSYVPKSEPVSEEWKQWIIEKRNVILEKIRAKEKLRMELADRKSVAAMKRARLVAKLSEDLEGNQEDKKASSTNASKKKASSKKKTTSKKSRKNTAVEEDQDLLDSFDGVDELGNFGDAEEDWDVYKAINLDSLQEKHKNGENDEDSEMYRDDDEMLLEEIDNAISKYNPEYFEELATQIENERANSVLMRYLYGPPSLGKQKDEPAQLHVNVERVRVTERLFQPSSNLAGIDTISLPEAIMSIVQNSSFDSGVVSAMCYNIVLCGGLSVLPGLKVRLLKELRKELPQEIPLKIQTSAELKKSQSSHLSINWNGASQLEEALPVIKKFEYEEFGSLNVFDKCNKRSDLFSNPSFLSSWQI